LKSFKIPSKIALNEAPWKIIIHIFCLDDAHSEKSKNALLLCDNDKARLLKRGAEIISACARYRPFVIEKKHMDLASTSLFLTFGKPRKITIMLGRECVLMMMSLLARSKIVFTSQFSN